MDGEKPPAFLDICEQVDRALVSLTSTTATPFTVNTSSLLRPIWSHFEAIDQSALWTSALHRVIRQKLLLANRAAWDLIEIYIPSRCDHILGQNICDFRSKDWLDDLILRIQRLTTSNAEEQPILSDEFVHHLSMRYMYTPSKRRNALSKANISNHVIEHVRNAVIFWLGFDQTNSSRWKACLTREIVAAFGIDVLLLDSVWDAHGHIKLHIFGTSNIALSITKFDSIRAPMQRHRNQLETNNPMLLPKMKVLGDALRTLQDGDLRQLEF